MNCFSLLDYTSDVTGGHKTIRKNDETGPGWYEQSASSYNYGVHFDNSKCHHLPSSFTTTLLKKAGSSVIPAAHPITYINQQLED